MNYRTYRVTVGTCDDATTVELDLTDAQADAFAFLGDVLGGARENECGARVVIVEAVA